MTIQEILDSLKEFSEKFPREALQEAQNKRQDIIPELLKALDYVIENIEEVTSGDYFLHMYAMYLLGEFREKQAFPKLVALMHLSEENISILGDSLTEDFPQLLCSTFDDENIQMLLDVIENQELYEYSRSAAVSAYGLLYRTGYILNSQPCRRRRYMVTE